MSFKLSKLVKKFKPIILNTLLTYCSAIFIEISLNSKIPMSFQETVKITMEYKISLYVILFLLLIFVLTYLTDYIVTNKIKKQKPNILFSNLMQKNSRHY